MITVIAETTTASAMTTLSANYVTRIKMITREIRWQPAPFWFKWFGIGGMALGSHIWVRTDLPDWKQREILNHEQQHVDDWARLGWFRYCCKYATRRGRLELEARAYARSIMVSDRSIESVVNSLASPMYCLWWVSRVEIIEAVARSLREFTE